MEQERQDQCVQDLINKLIKDRGLNRSRTAAILIGQERDEWIELSAILIHEGFMTKSNSHPALYVVTPRGDLYGGDRYIKEQQKKRVSRQQIEEKEKKEAEKFETDLIIARWQKRTYWWVFGLGGIGGICGIISLCIQLTAKPIVEKEYIRIDSHGKIYKNEK